MAEDVVFFFKTFPDAGTKALPWPGPVRLIGVDPPAGCLCGGSDKLCSSAYSCMWQSLRGADGRALPGLLARYAKGVTPKRVALVGFSAAHGILNPLLNNDADRRAVSAAILIDTCFGGGKTGFQKSLKAGASGEQLFVTMTSHDGSPWKSADDLHSGTLCFERNVLAPTGLQPKLVEVRAPALPPSGGTFRIGSNAYWLRYANAAGKTELPHYEIRVKHQNALLAAYLLPYWRGELGGGLPTWAYGALGAAAVGGGYYAWSRWKKRRSG
jgi:hypothetical protein